MKLEPKAASLSSQARPLSGNGHVLTWESSTNKINWFGGAGCDIFAIRDKWGVESAIEKGDTGGIDLALPGARHTGALQAEIEAANTGE